MRSTVAGSPSGADHGSFEGFYRATHEWALQLGWLLCGNRAVCEDAVQDAYGALFARFHRIENPHAYLRVSIVNGLRTRHRRTEMEHRRLHLVGSRADAIVDGSTIELARSVAKLPYKERVAIVCRYWADLPEEEIADILGVRPATVRSLVSRALVRLRLEVER